MTKKSFDFIGKRKIFAIIAACLIVIGIILNIFLGTELDINFKGGAIFTYSFSGDIDQAAVTAIAKNHLGDEVEVDFTNDVSGENKQVNFTLVDIPSTVLTYAVTGTPDEAAIQKSANEVFACETSVVYDKEAATLTVDPSELVTDSMVDDFTNALSSTEEDAPTFTLTSSNTVSELADAMLNQMVTDFGTKVVYTLSKTDLDVTEATSVAENTLQADLTLTVDQDAGTLTLVPADSALALSAEAIKTVTTALQEEYADAGIALQSETYNAIALVTSNSVKATVGKGFFIKCLFAMVLGGLFMILYIGFRFRKIGGISAGVFATMALVHDILIAYFVYVIFGIPLNDNFIAVVLTILGYSINGTIVIYDRIRENQQKLDAGTSLDEIVNISVNETFTRNVFTSISTFIAIATVAVVAWIYGLTSIISFALPMSVGVVAGFYSSVFLSTPLWAKWRGPRRAKEAANPKKKTAAKIRSKKRR